MSERLLKENVALKKIELSLKLQGKTFNGKFVNCHNCKFCWRNKPYGMNKPKRWSADIYNFTTQQNEPNPLPKPEKAGFYCYRYKCAPNHAYLRFKAVRLNAEGQVVPVKGYYNSQNEWTNAPQVGEKDTLILMAPGTHWQYSVCRRFEACPR